MLCNEIFGKKANKQTKHKKMKNTSCFLSCMNMKIIVCYILEESLDNLTSTFSEKGIFKTVRPSPNVPKSFRMSSIVTHFKDVSRIL